MNARLLHILLSGFFCADPRWIPVLGQQGNTSECSEHHQHRTHYGASGWLWEFTVRSSCHVVCPSHVLGSEPVRGGRPHYEVACHPTQVLGFLQLLLCKLVIVKSCSNAVANVSVTFWSLQDSILALEALGDFSVRETNRDFYQLTIYISGTARQWGGFEAVLNRTNYEELQIFEVILFL